MGEGMKPFRIIVPSSSANIGPGFDSVGLGLSCFLTLEVMVQDTWEIRHKSGPMPSFSDYTDHYIYQIARRIASEHGKEMPGCKVIISSEIPLARGLGSSASAVLAGIELANQLCGLKLSDLEKLEYGTEIEGHPDNIAASLFGGIVITAISQDDQVEYIQVPAPEFDIVVYIPATELKTEEARRVLPESYSRGQAARASAVSNVMIAALLQGNFQLAGKMMQHDFSRSHLEPHLFRTT